MAFKDFRVVYIDKFQNEFILDNVISTRVTLQKDAKSNSCELVLHNRAMETVEESEIKYEADEFIRIYAKEGIVTYDDSELLGTFKITDIEPQPEPNLLRIIGTDITYLLLNRLYTRDVTGTAPEIIENIVETNAEDGVTINSVTKNIAQLNSQGQSFPEKQFTSLWKTAYEAINELSQTDYTGDDKPYIFWLNPDGTFNWQYPPQTPKSTLFINGYEPVLSMKLQKVESETVNMIIYDAGEDKNGNAILGFYVKPDSSKVKGAIKYQPMTDIRNLVRARYSDVDFDLLDNDEFVSLCELEAQAKAKNMVDAIGEGLWNSTIKVRGDYYTPGDLYTVVANRNGFVATNLRLERIVHRLDKDGWETELKLAEDATVEETE